jgi:ribose-phosphate pyrophosphokinase
VRINNKKIIVNKYDNNELFISKKDIEEAISLREKNVIIDFEYESSDSLISLILALNYIREVIGENKNIIIDTGYFPYTRESKNNNVDTIEPLALMLRPFIDYRTTIILNDSTNYDFMISLVESFYKFSGSISSRITINNALHKIIKYSLSNGYLKYNKNTYFAFRNKEVFDRFKLSESKYIYIKDNGEIETKCIPDGDFNVIILDNICSRGGTFYNLSKSLKNLGAKDITLVSTFCEESILDGPLLKEDSPIDRIITTNSLISETNLNKIRILDFDLFRLESIKRK